MSKIEIHSITWRTVEALVNETIEQSTERLIRQGTDPIKTEFERGVIKAMKSVLKLSEAP